MLTGTEDAQMSSRYRWLVPRPASHALPSAVEALAEKPLGALRKLPARLKRELIEISVFEGLLTIVNYVYAGAAAIST
jgi:hypothetical protein